MTWWTILRWPGRISAARTNRSSVRPVGSTKQRYTSPLEKSGVKGWGIVRTASGVPSVQPEEKVSAGGRSTGLPSGAPEVTHVVIVERSELESDGSPSYALQAELMCQGGILRCVVWIRISLRC